MSKEERNQSAWKIVKVFEQGMARVEVSSLPGYNPKYSTRVGWKDGERGGAWFPYREDSSYAEDIAKCVSEAEAWVLEEIGKALAKIDADLTEQRKRSDEKKKRHEANVERRRNENRAATAKAKGGR